MIRKVYKSATVISFSITYPSGSYQRVRFTPFSWGGGIYVTEDETEQELIEKNKEFGISFFLESVIGDTEEKKEEKTESEDEVEAEEKKFVEVNDIDEAKDYLVENYNMLRSKLRSTVAIKAAAADKGIEFIGI